MIWVSSFCKIATPATGVCRLRALLLSLFLFCSAAIGQEVEESLSLGSDAGPIIEGRIDWTNNEIIAYGEGVAPDDLTNPARQRLMGALAAKVVAYRNLLELIGEVRIDSKTQVGMAMVQSDSVRIRLEGIVRGARIVQGSQTEVDGLYRVALRLKLLNDFTEAVLPVAATNAAEENSFDESELDSLLTYLPEAYTGLIVDARGLDLQPSMAPKILAASGAQIYGVGIAEQHFITSIGLVGYHKDPEQAAGSDRLGGNEAHPLVVKAEKVSGLYNADVVVSNEDAANIRFADTSAEFLKECRVALILGPAPVDTVLADSVLTDSTNLEDLDFDFRGEAEDSDRTE